MPTGGGNLHVSGIEFRQDWSRNVKGLELRHRAGNISVMARMGNGRPADPDQRHEE
jgi:hypothetical protein